MLLRRSPPKLPTWVFDMCPPRGAPRIAGASAEDRLDSLVLPLWFLPFPTAGFPPVQCHSMLLLLGFVVGEVQKGSFTEFDATMWPELWGKAFLNNHVGLASFVAPVISSLCSL